MDTIEIDFAHSVGDFVMTAWDLQTRKPGERRDRDAWQVIERTYNEHCGGVRIQYVCRSQALFNNREKTYAFDPCELVAMPADMRSEPNGGK
jgi:hypothetical protein